MNQNVILITAPLSYFAENIYVFYKLLSGQTVVTNVEKEMQVKSGNTSEGLYFHRRLSRYTRLIRDLELILFYCILYQHFGSPYIFWNGISDRDPISILRNHNSFFTWCILIKRTDRLNPKSYLQMICKFLRVSIEISMLCFTIEKATPRKSNQLCCYGAGLAKKSKSITSSLVTLIYSMSSYTTGYIL